MLGSTLLHRNGPASPVCCAHPASTATLQSAVIQDLIARHNLPSPAHPSQAIHWHSTTSHAQQHSLHTVSDTPPYQQSPVSPAMLHIELPTLTNLDDLITQRPAATGYLQSSARTSPKHLPTCPQTQQQISKLQTILATVDVAKAVAKHPLLLSYCPATLQQHMQKLEDLVGADAAASMVVKMPQLLHFKSSTLAAKLDHLYDLLPKVDVSKVVVRSPFLLGISTATLADRLEELQTELAGSDVQRMAEYCPSILECKVGRVVGNLKALEHMLPEEVDLSTVVQYMPSLLLSDMKKVEDKYMRLQILCMHTPRWRRDLMAIQHKPATFARLLGISHRVIDRLAFLLEHREPTQLGAATVLLMSKAKFQARFAEYDSWLQHRDTAQHTNAWQAGNPIQVLSSLDQATQLPRAV